MGAKGGIRKLPLLLAGLLLAGYMAYLFMGQAMILRDLNAEKASLQVQQAEWVKKNESLQQDIEFSKTESFIERMAREILGWVKHGEIKIAEKE
jgi:cell division protein FtsB